jgi:hypothetical protein
VKPATTSGTQYLIAKGGAQASGNAASYGLYLNTGVPTAYIRDGNSGQNVEELSAPASLTMDQWHHVAFTFSNTSLAGTLYVDGQEVAAAVFAQGPPKNSGNLYIGASDATPNTAFDGRLDELRFWSVVRTAAQIEAAYATTLTGSETGLIAWWPFLEGTGNPVDAKGGLTISLTGVQWVQETPVLP